MSGLWMHVDDIGSDHTHLRTFFPMAAEVARQREASQQGVRLQLANIRSALRLGRNVSTAPQKIA